MEKEIFHLLLDKVSKDSKWHEYIESLIFANITYELEKEIVTGNYEFFGKYSTTNRNNQDKDILETQNNIKTAINASFDEISNDNCFSLYRYLKTEKIRYARIVRNPLSVDSSDVCRFAKSVDDNINEESRKYSVSMHESRNVITQIGQKDAKNKIPLDTILKFYREDYYNAIYPKDKQIQRFTVFYYLIRPSLDNIKLNGMLYFASTRLIERDALKEMATLLSDKLIDVVFERVQKEAIKSAISSIMSRNMSHNLGSHYLYYTKTYLEDLANSCGEKGPDIRGAAKVLGYMQARMDYLATIISNDRYPNGAVNFKSQIYDELTIDDFSKRHFKNYSDRCKRTTNFLLSNLVMSENFTRGSILKNSASCEQNMENKFHPIRIQVMYWNEEENSYEIFTGSSHSPKMDKERGIKNDLSKLNISLPGGTMSCHAFFNVIENFIRNSAKYLQEDFKKEGLVFTIAIKRNQLVENAFDFIIFDNKNNATKVLDIVNQQLKDLRILDEKGRIEKSSKGLKEMLFSAIWMQASTYKNDTFADIINIIQLEEKQEDKLKLIQKYGFSFVPVSSEGVIHKEALEKDNLGLKITLPEFRFAKDFTIKKSDSERDIIQKALSMSSDIVCFNMKKPESIKDYKYLSYFTRVYYNKDFEEEKFNEFLKSAKVLSKDDSMAKNVYKFKCILDSRFQRESNGDIDNLCLSLGGDLRDIKLIPKDHSRIIYFERHLSTKKRIEDYVDYAYVDTISGGNYTITLNSLFEDGLTKNFKYKTWNDFLYALKIKESALTRITLIDERLFNNMNNDIPSRKTEYALKNIRILNVNIEGNNSTPFILSKILEGNKFVDNSNRTHFLSIHLGLIEKIVKTEWEGKFGKCSSIEDKVNLLMQKLEIYFGGGEEKVFISIHSGRGNFSKELEGPLASYPFISLAAIENAFSNSKYLLSQLFYNNVYIGKGIINE